MRGLWKHKLAPLWFYSVPSWFIIVSVVVSCVVLMLFRFGTHWPHCGQTPVQFRSGVVHLRFKVGSSLDQMCFRCGSIWVQFEPNVLKSLVQCWFRFHAQLVHGWFDGCSTLPDVWFCAGSSVVQLWLRFGSGLVQRWAHTLGICG